MDRYSNSLIHDVRNRSITAYSLYNINPIAVCGFNEFNVIEYLTLHAGITPQDSWNGFCATEIDS